MTTTATGELARKVGAGRATQIRGKALTGSLEYSDFSSLGEFTQTKMVENLAAGNNDQEVTRILARIQNARARGDDDEVETEMKTLRDFVKTNIMAKGGVTWGGSIDHAVAFVAHMGGDDATAKDLLLKGGGETTAYGDVKSAKKRAYDTAIAAGLSPKLAEQLSSGGEGSSLVAKLGAMEKSGTLDGIRAVSFVEDIGSTYVSRLSGLEGDAYYGEIAAILKEKGAGDFTAGDVQAAEEMFGSVRADQELVGSTMVKTADGLERRGGRTVTTATRGEVGLRLSGAAQAGQGTVAWTDAVTAARAQISVAPPEIQAALSAELNKLSEAMSGEPDPDEVSAALEAIAAKAATGDLTGVAGGKGFAAIGARRKEAMGASTQGIGRIYGLGDESATLATIAGMELEGVNVHDGLNAEERKAAAQALSQLDVLSSMGATAGGGIYLRGETPEVAMMLQLGVTAVKVNEMPESVDKMVRTVDESPFLSFWGTSEQEQ